MSGCAFGNCKQTGYRSELDTLAKRHKLESQQAPDNDKIDVSKVQRTDSSINSRSLHQHTKELQYRAQKHVYTLQ